MDRRSFVQLGLFSVPATLVCAHAQSEHAAGAQHGIKVNANEDRFQEKHSLGFSSMFFKVATADSAGGLFLMEHGNLGRGGPYRHLHPQQDEWLYALEGQFVVEVGDGKFTLGPGDSIVMPRNVPHVWAQVGTTPGRLLVGFTPAGNMEAFFRDFGKTGKMPADGAILSQYGLIRVGPPLTL